MADITKCKNESCPLKEYCYRWTAPASEWQAYTKFDFYWEDIAGAAISNCNYFIPNYRYIKGKQK